MSLTAATVGRELRRMGCMKLSARPRQYAQDEAALATFKKKFPERLKEIRAMLDDGVEVEVWWQDEAGVGQKNKITRR